MNNSHRSRTAVTLVACCLTLAALAGCGRSLVGSETTSQATGDSEVQSIARTSDAVQAIDVEEIRNYHLSIHG